MYAIKLILLTIFSFSCFLAINISGFFLFLLKMKENCHSKCKTTTIEMAHALV